MVKKFIGKFCSNREHIPGLVLVESCSINHQKSDRPLFPFGSFFLKSHTVRMSRTTILTTQEVSERRSLV